MARALGHSPLAAARLAAGLALMLGVGCNGGVDIAMYNFADWPVHLWVDGFEEMGPDNKLEPLQNRTWSENDRDVDGGYVVVAGRDGVELASASCTTDEKGKVRFEAFFEEEGFAASLSCRFDD